MSVEETKRSTNLILLSKSRGIDHDSNTSKQNYKKTEHDAYFCSKILGKGGKLDR